MDESADRNPRKKGKRGRYPLFVIFDILSATLRAMQEHTTHLVSERMNETFRAAGQAFSTFRRNIWSSLGLVSFGKLC